MIDTWQRRTMEHPRVIDAMTAVAAFGLFLLGCELTVSGSHEPDTGVGLRVILAAVSCVALLWQRTRPRAVVVATAVCAGAASGLGYLLTPLILAPVMLALFQLALRTDRRTTRLFTLAVLIQVVITAVFADTGHPLAYRTIAPAAWVLLPVVGGSAVRLRNAYLDEVRARAEHASAPGRRRRGTGSPKSGCASPGNCTTWSPTTWPWPTPRRGRPRTSPATAPSRSAASSPTCRARRPRRCAS
ncbi:hypothetical protein AB0L25_12550 [Spirillospora sp. NPDC052242]